MPARKDTTTEQALWACFYQVRDSINRNRLIEYYRSASIIIAKHLFRMYGSDISELDDFIQEAQIGLSESIERYRQDSEAEFMTYANYRIRGQILNSLKYSSERASFYDYQKRLRKSRSESVLADLTSERASFQNVGESIIRLAYTELLDSIFEAELEQFGNAPLVDDSGDASPAFNSTNPYQSYAIHDLKVVLKNRLQTLPVLEKQVIELHYYGQMAFEEIGQIVGLSKTRISQIHKTAVLALREYDAADKSI